MKKLTCKRLVNSILDKKNIFTFYALILGIIAIPLMVSTMQSPKTFISRAMVIGDNSFGGGEADAEAGVPIIEGGSTDDIIVDDVPRDVVDDYNRHDLEDIYRDKKEFREEQRDEVIINTTKTPDQPDAAPAAGGGAEPTPTIQVVSSSDLTETADVNGVTYTFMKGGTVAGSVGEKAWGDCIANRPKQTQEDVAACTEEAKAAYNSMAKKYPDLLTPERQKFDDAITKVKDIWANDPNHYKIVVGEGVVYPNGWDQFWIYKGTNEKTKYITPASDQILWDAAKMLAGGNASDPTNAITNAVNLDKTRQSLETILNKLPVNDWPIIKSQGLKDDNGNRIVKGNDNYFTIDANGYHATVTANNLPEWANINEETVQKLKDMVPDLLAVRPEKWSDINAGRPISFVNHATDNPSGFENAMWTLQKNSDGKLDVFIDGKRLEGDFKLPTVTDAPKPPTTASTETPTTKMNDVDTKAMESAYGADLPPTTTPILPPTQPKPVLIPGSEELIKIENYADLATGWLLNDPDYKDGLNGVFNGKPSFWDVKIKGSDNKEYTYKIEISYNGTEFIYKVDGKPLEKKVPYTRPPDTTTLIPVVTLTPFQQVYSDSASRIYNIPDVREILTTFPNMSLYEAEKLLMSLKVDICIGDITKCDSSWLPNHIVTPEEITKFQSDFNKENSIIYNSGTTPVNQKINNPNYKYNIITTDRYHNENIPGILIYQYDEIGNNTGDFFIDYDHAWQFLKEFIDTKKTAQSAQPQPSITPLPGAPTAAPTTTPTQTATATRTNTPLAPTGTPTPLSSTSDLKNDMISKAMEYCRLFQKSDCPEIDEQLQTITDINKLGEVINTYGLNPNAQTPIPQPDSKQTTTNPAQTTLSLIGCLATLKYSLMDCLKGVIIPAASTPTPDTTTQPPPAQPTDTPAPEAAQTFGDLALDEALDKVAEEYKDYGGNAYREYLVNLSETDIDKNDLVTLLNVIGEANCVGLCPDKTKLPIIDIRFDGEHHIYYNPQDPDLIGIMGPKINVDLTINIIRPILENAVKTESKSNINQNNEDFDQKRMEWWTAWEKSVRNIFGNLLKASPESTKPSTVPPTPALDRTFSTGTVVNHRKADDPPANVVPDINVWGTVIGENLNSKVIPTGSPRLIFSDKDTTGLSVFKVNGVGKPDTLELTTLIKHSDGSNLTNPIFTALYNLNNWVWTDSTTKTTPKENGPIPPNREKDPGVNWGANAASIQTSETDTFYVPNINDENLTSSMEVYVLYAEDDKIDLRYINVKNGVNVTDSVASTKEGDNAFTLHLTNLNVSKDIVDQVKALGFGVDRTKMLKLKIGDIIGTPKSGQDVVFAAMANGGFIDPRVKKDLWNDAPEPPDGGLFKIEEAAKGPNGTNVVKEFNSLPANPKTLGDEKKAKELFDIANKFIPAPNLTPAPVVKKFDKDDPRAPVIDSMIKDPANIGVKYYQCSNNQNCVGQINMIGFTPDKSVPIYAPVSYNGNNYDVGGGFGTIVTWISDDGKSIALSYTPDGNNIAPTPDPKTKTGGGYTVVFNGVNIKEALIKEYRERKQGSFPALKPGQDFGTTNGEVKVFMNNDGKIADLRSFIKK